jgi:hypothetical protein
MEQFEGDKSLQKISEIVLDLKQTYSKVYLFAWLERMVWAKQPC